MSKANHVECGREATAFLRRNSFRRLKPGRLRMPEEKAAAIAAALHMRMRISQKMKFKKNAPSVNTHGAFEILN